MTPTTIPPTKKNNTSNNNNNLHFGSENYPKLTMDLAVVKLKNFEWANGRQTVSQSDNPSFHHNTLMNCFVFVFGFACFFPLAGVRTHRTIKIEPNELYQFNYKFLFLLECVNYPKKMKRIMKSLPLSTAKCFFFLSFKNTFDSIVAHRSFMCFAHRVLVHFYDESKQKIINY